VSESVAASHAIATDAVRWDGRTLTVAAPPGTSAGGVTAIALNLDGCHFATVDPDRNGNATFDLPLSPSGHALVSAQLRHGRDGLVLHEPAFVLHSGMPGTVATSTTVPPLAPLSTPRRPVN
jgi:hypothetical protein